MNTAIYVGLFIFALATVIPVPASGADTNEELDDGNTMLRWCKLALRKEDGDRTLNANELVTAVACEHWVRGFWEGGTFVYDLRDAARSQLKNKKYTPHVTRAWCSPNTKNFRVSQAVRVFVKFLEANPQRLHEDSIFLLAESLMEAFPCNRP